MVKRIDRGKGYITGALPELEIKPLPKAPHWKQALGVGVITIGLAIGTGELIMWPHLVVKFGLGILWGAFLGLTFQYFINQEVARRTLATGESFFTSSIRLSPYLMPFWLVSALLLYVWPGWAGALGTTLSALFGFGNHLVWAWLSLLFILILSFTGRVAYVILEKSLKIIVPVFFVLLLVISFLTLEWFHLKQALLGIFNFGWLPQAIDIEVFLGAVVFAGAGGLLNLCVSLWYRDKQAGMGKYVGRIVNPITGKPEAVSATGYAFTVNKENLKNWEEWLRYIRIDQGIIFWFLGLVTLMLISVNAYAVLFPQGLVPEGLQVAVVQANIFGNQWGVWGYKLFLLMASLMLFSVMWAVIDGFTRIVTDILYVNSRAGPFRKYLSWVKKFSIHRLYYGLIVGLVVLGAVLLPFRQPLIFLVVSSVLGGLTMAVYTPLILYLNNFRLPKELRPGWFTNLMLVFASLFYGFFSIWIIIEKVGKILTF
jgi:hypothetical protein